MQPEDIEVAFAGESDRVEWKQSSRKADVVLSAVCALANDLGDTRRPGFLVLGLDDGGGTVGEDTSDTALQNLANRFRSTKILPNPSCSTHVVPRDGKSVIVVRVEPYPVPPVVKLDGVAWVRVGTTTRLALDADITRLSERRPENRLPFDFRAWPAATLDDLDLATLRVEHGFRRATDADSDSFPDFEKWLVQRDLARMTDSGPRPTAAGILVYGADPQAQMPGAAIEFVRYAADLDSPVVARKTITGSLPAQLEALWVQLQANSTDVPGPTDGIRTPYVPDYPMEALKELARNLVQHRLYESTHAPGRVSWLEDRVIFNNPGGPFGQASEGQFGAHSDYRNPTITRLLVELGYVERLGRGIARARSQLAANGNPELQVEHDGFTTIMVRRRS